MKSKKYNRFFCVYVLFLLFLLGSGAQGSTWDIVYNGDVIPTAAGWTEGGNSAGSVNLGVEGGVTYLHIDTLGSGEGQDRYYYMGPPGYDVDLTSGVTVTFRALFYDGTMHNVFL